MPLPTRVTLPPQARPVGGLLTASRPLAGEWWRGVTFSTTACTAPQTTGACAGDGDSPDVKTQQRPGEPATFDAFGVIHAIECSTLGNPDVRTLAEQSLDVTREFAVAREFLTGTASGNPSLAGASTIAAAAPDAETALACLEQIAASTLSGRLAFIHASPILASALLSASVIYRDGLRWLTATGNIVVISTGYDGRAPGGSAPAAGDPLYLYATGEVYTAVGNRDTLESIDRSVNTIQAWSEEAAIAVFDPCFTVAIESGLVFCDLTVSP